MKNQLLVPASLRVLSDSAWALLYSWYSLLRGESSDIFAYLILNSSECLASLSGISFRTNDLHIGALLLCSLTSAKFPCKNIFELPVLLSATAVCLLSKPCPASGGIQPRRRVKCTEMPGCSRTGLEMTECHLHAGCQSLLGPVFASTEPLLVVVCLAIT